METLLWALFGIIAGACIATQAPINVQLGKGLGLPIAAAATSFLAGAVALWFITLVFARVQGVSLDFTAPAPWLFIAGGLLGAVYVFSTVILTPIMGAAAVMALSVTGQLIAGIALDRIGFMGMAVREISLGRVAGAVLLVAGAVMIRVL
jgi:bacterial/archaeal transporter family-2 protein